MANPIEPFKLYNTTNFVAFTSRYINSPLIYYGNDKKITYETYKRKEYKETDQDKFFTILPGLEYRPDLVSYRFYGTVDYWWKIMEFNYIYDILDF